MYTMICYCPILLSFFVLLPPIYAHTSSTQNLALFQNRRTILWDFDSKISDIEAQMHETRLQSPFTAKTTDLVSLRGHTLTPHGQHHLGNVHGILILIGWGIMLPIGVIVARYCRKFPINCNEWYSSHMVCQILGYIMGTIGWFIGIGLGSSSKQYASPTQRTLSIIAFTLINIQMLSIFMLPKKEQGYCKSWNICHHVLGYAIIAIMIGSIFEGINNQSEAEKLKWVYVGILGVLALVAAALEIFRCIKSKIVLQSVQSASNMYFSSPETK